MCCDDRQDGSCRECILSGHGLTHTSTPLVCAAAAAAQDHQDLRRTITNIIHGKALQWELSPDTFRKVAQKLYPDAGRLLAKLKDKDRQKNLLSNAEQLVHAADVDSDGEVGRFVKEGGNLKHLTAFCKAGLHQLSLMTIMTMTEGDLCCRSVYQQLAYVWVTCKCTTTSSLQSSSSNVYVWVAHVL
jgi:hypothetical protein